jgi:hypothetical protein
MSTIAVAATSLPERDAYTRFRRRMRAGAVALILAAIASALVPLGTTGIPTNPAQNIAFATGANSWGWRVGMMLALVYQALLVLGSLALYVHLSQTRAERWAFAGLVVTVGCTMLFVPMMGFAAFVVPAVGALIEAGHTDAVAVMDQTFREPFAILPFLGGIFVNLGLILNGVVVWRSGTLPKWAGLLLIVGGVLGVPAFLDVPQAGLVATPLTAAALITIGASLWKHPTTDGTESRHNFEVDRASYPPLQPDL